MTNSGHYLKICSLQHGEPFLVIGPDRWIFLLSLLLTNAISAAILVILRKSDGQNSSFFLVHCVSIIFLDISWIATAFISPGFGTDDSDNNTDCYFCENPDAQDFVDNQNHCPRCGTCIKDRMHHCRLTGNCIGKGNKIVYHFLLLAGLVETISVASTLPYIYYLF